MGNNITPRHWFQFADDATISTSTESENQVLLNCFTRWCQWSNMTIRVDKCTTFGIKKYMTSSSQYLPKVFVNNERVPSTKMGGSFTYLGKHFNYSMNDELHKSNIIETITSLMKLIDHLQLDSKNKLMIYQKFVLSKISWDFTVSDISKTWVVNNIDNVISSYIRSWFEIPINGTLDILTLSSNNFGIALVLPSQKFIQCQITKRNILRTSLNGDIKSLYHSTTNSTNLQFDKFRNGKEYIESYRKDKQDRVTNVLKNQGFILTSILKNGLKYAKPIWSLMQQSLPKNIYSFSLRYLNNTLATKNNLALWNLVANNECSFCHQPESLLHVVAGCNIYLNEGRFNWRHDSVLAYLVEVLKSRIDIDIYADLENHRSPSIITGMSYRPDLVLLFNNTVYVLELTVGFETNLIKNVERKEEKYRNMILDLEQQHSNVSFINLSIGAIGIFSSHSTTFISMLKSMNFDDREIKFTMQKIMSICIRTTYFIFCRRNKDWSVENYLNF